VFFFTCSPRPPTLSQHHMDLHVWAYPGPGYIFQVSSKSVPGFRRPMQGVKIWPFPLLWLFAFTTARTTVQAAAYSASTVIASDKSSISTNRKSTTRFPTSHRRSMYVTPKSPKGWLKTRIFTLLRCLSHLCCR